MVDIDKEQYKMLKQINKINSLSCNNLTEKETEIIKFLIENNFVESIQETKTTFMKYNIPITESITVGYKITQSGRAQIYAYKSKFYQIKFSIIMSIISAIISIIALLKP